MNEVASGAQSMGLQSSFLQTLASAVLVHGLRWAINEIGPIGVIFIEEIGNLIKIILLWVLRYTDVQFKAIGGHVLFHEDQ